jgi:hypothetical protein
MLGWPLIGLTLRTPAGLILYIKNKYVMLIRVAVRVTVGTRFPRPSEGSAKNGGSFRVVW